MNSLEAVLIGGTMSEHSVWTSRCWKDIRYITSFNSPVTNVITIPDFTFGNTEAKWVKGREMRALS